MVFQDTILRSHIVSKTRLAASFSPQFIYIDNKEFCTNVSKSSPAFSVFSWTTTPILSNDKSPQALITIGYVKLSGQHCLEETISTNTQSAF